MATGKAKKDEKPAVKENRTFTFVCKFCGRSQRLEDMRVLIRFSPPLIACRECEGVLR